MIVQKVWEIDLDGTIDHVVAIISSEIDSVNYVRDTIKVETYWNVEQIMRNGWSS